MEVAVLERRPFEPLDEMSESDKILGLMLSVPVGDVMSYDEVSRILGREFLNDRGPYYKALDRLHRNHPEKGTFLTIPKIGFRRSDTLDDAKSMVNKRKRQSRKQLRLGRNVTKAPDRSRLTETERRELDALAEGFHRLENQVGLVGSIATKAFNKAEKAQAVALAAHEAIASQEDRIKELISNTIDAKLAEKRALRS